MKYEDISEGIRTAIHDEWNDFSHELAMNSEDGRFSMMDIRKAFYAGIDSVLKQLGWHPASELPKEGEEVMVMPTGFTTAYRAVFIDGIYYSVIVGKKAYYPSVKWWCYPPKED